MVICAMCDKELEIEDNPMCNSCYRKFKLVLVRFARGIKGEYSNGKTHMEFNLRIDFPGNHMEIVKRFEKDNA